MAFQEFSENYLILTTFVSWFSSIFPTISVLKLNEALLSSAGKSPIVPLAFKNDSSR